MVVKTSKTATASVHSITPFLDSKGLRVLKPYADMLDNEVNIEFDKKVSLDIDWGMLNTAKKTFDYQNMPFMHMLLQNMKHKQPYKGLKILHNTHLTWSTVTKIECLLASGAEVTATVTDTLFCDPEIIDFLKEANVKFVAQEDLVDDFDIALDCCADLYPQINPRIGVIEQTKTGANLYAQIEDPDFAIVSIDDTETKKLETFYGTGDGFIRGLQKHYKQSISDLSFCVFGFGKVGHGIARAINEHTDQVSVIDKDWGLFESDEELNFSPIDFSEHSKVKVAIKQSDVIVMATGVKDLISNEFDKELFDGKILINMGSEDEFGDKFSSKDVLGGKGPINFTLNEPTLAKYLDPIFYLHNHAIDILLANKGKKGMLPVPELVDNNILSSWQDFYRRTLY